MGRHEHDGLDVDDTEEKPPRPRSWLPLVLGVVFALLMAALMLQINSVRGQIQKAESDSHTLADQVRQLGGVPRVSPAPGPPGERGEPGRPPSGQEISAAVSSYLAAYPPPAGRAPTSREIAAAVSAYLKDNPPQPGRSPTSEEIATAVAAYLRQNPPARGPAGEKGEPGETVTGSPGPKGEPGKDSTVPGPQGERGPAGPPPSLFEFTHLGTRYVCRPTEPESTKFECAPEAS